MVQTPREGILDPILHDINPEGILDPILDDIRPYGKIWVIGRSPIRRQLRTLFWRIYVGIPTSTELKVSLHNSLRDSVIFGIVN